MGIENPHNRIEFFGSAMSDFQAEPVLYGPDGQPLPPMSDWELEVHRNLDGKESGVKNPLQKDELPRFLKNKEKYLDRSQELGENMFRLSFDFGRLCPESGIFNSEHMAEYIRALAQIRVRGQEPMVTLHHFTMPKFLVETNNKDEIVKGGWENPEVTKHFSFYFENVMRFLGDQDRIKKILDSEGIPAAEQEKLLEEGLARYFISINEPMTTLQ